MQNKKYKKDCPFCKTAITDIIRTHFFSKWKVDKATLKKMVKSKTVIHPIIILVVTTVSDCIFMLTLYSLLCRLKMHWRNRGVALKQPFHLVMIIATHGKCSPQSYTSIKLTSSSYYWHLGTWKNLQSKLPIYTQKLQESMFNKIMCISYKFFDY